MSNIINPKVEVTLDRVRHMVFDFNAAAHFEQVTSKNMLRGGVIANMSATDMRAFLWACLIWEDPDLTLGAVGSMMHFGNMNYLSDKIAELYNATTPQVSGDERPLAPANR